MSVFSREDIRSLDVFSHRAIDIEGIIFFRLDVLSHGAINIDLTERYAPDVLFCSKT